MFSEMKAVNVALNIVAYNTLINGFSQTGSSEMGGRFYKELVRNGIKADILNYNALILGLCKVGKTRKAVSTFSALITGQCVRKKSKHTFQIYKSMIKSGCHSNKQTFEMLISSFCEDEDFDGAIHLMQEMLERCMAPDTGILSKLYSGLCQCGKDQLAMKLLNEMEIRLLLPGGFDKAKIVNSKPENHDKEVEDNP